MTTPRWMTRNVKTLSAVSLMQDAASEMLYPLMPILLTTTLGAPAAVVGLVEGVAEGVAALMKYLSGRFSDRVGRKPLVGLGYGLAAVGKTIVAAAGIWPIVLVGRVVDRIGKGARGAPRDALLAEDVATPELGRVFGFHRAADTTGAVIGPLLGLAILSLTGDNIRAALWVAVIPATISVALVGFVREKPRGNVAVPTPTADGESPSAPGPAVDAGAAPAASLDTAPAASLDTAPAASLDTAPAASLDTLGEAAPAKPEPLSRKFVQVVAVLALIALVNFPDALVLLRVSQLGFSVQGVIGAYVIYNLVYALGSYPAGVLADRMPRARVYALGLACFAIGYVGLGLVDGGWAVVALLCVYGGFNAMTDGVGKAWISSLVPAASRGRAQGIFQGTMGASVLVAGLWAGVAWDLGAGDGVVPLVVAGTAAAVGSVSLWIAGRRLG